MCHPARTQKEGVVEANVKHVCGVWSDHACEAVRKLNAGRPNGSLGSSRRSSRCRMIAKPRTNRVQNGGVTFLREMVQAELLMSNLRLLSEPKALLMLPRRIAHRSGRAPAVAKFTVLA